MNTKRVFILGAGFSKMAGMPLATDLTNDLFEKFREYDQKDALEWLGYLQQRIDWLREGKSKSINIEEVFDLAQFDIELWKMRQQLCEVKEWIQHAERRIKERTEKMNNIEMWSKIKYFLHKWMFVAGLVLLVISRAINLCSSQPISLV